MSVGCCIVRFFYLLLLMLPLLLLPSRSTVVHALKLPSSSFSRISTSSRSFTKTTTTALKMSSGGASDTTADAAKKALLNCPTIPMRDGTAHPAIGFGTYKVGFIPKSAASAVAGTDKGVDRTASECVADALDVGYRFLECAEFYGNENEVGKAIAKSGIPRKDLFICSKVWTTTIEKGPTAVREQLEQTLKDLQTDYVDLYLIHWPVPGHHVQAYKTLIELKAEGKIKGIGVSNYAWEDYLELKNDPDIKEEDLPLVNQIEINPFLYRKNTIELFQKDGVVMQSYRSLRDGKAMDHPLLVEIASKKGNNNNNNNKTTPAQILGRWCVQKGFVYVPKSVKKERMVENSQVFDDDFVLSDDEMVQLDKLTTPDAIETFKGLYRKCVNRDTSKDGTMDGVKMDVTLD